MGGWETYAFSPSFSFFFFSCFCFLLHRLSGNIVAFKSTKAIMCLACQLYCSINKTVWSVPPRSRSSIIFINLPTNVLTLILNWQHAICARQQLFACFSPKPMRECAWHVLERLGVRKVKTPKNSVKNSVQKHPRTRWVCKKINHLYHIFALISIQLVSLGDWTGLCVYYTYKLGKSLADHMSR